MKAKKLYRYPWWSGMALAVLIALTLALSTFYLMLFFIYG